MAKWLIMSHTTVQGTSCSSHYITLHDNNTALNIDAQADPFFSLVYQLAWVHVFLGLHNTTFFLPLTTRTSPLTIYFNLHYHSSLLLQCYNIDIHLRPIT